MPRPSSGQAHAPFAVRQFNTAALLALAALLGAPDMQAAQSLVTRVAPGAPTNLAATVNGFAVSFTWQAPVGGDPPVSYVVEAGTFSGGTNALVMNIGNVTNFAATSPAPGTFFVAVRAMNADGVGPRSNEVMVTIPGGGLQPPPPPAGLSAQATGTTVTIMWVGSPGATSYQIRASLSAGGPVIATLPVAGTSISVPNVGAGTYYLTVVAIGPGGTSAPSNEVSVTVGGTPPPPQPLSPCGVIGAAPAPSLLADWSPIFQGEACAGPNSPVVEIQLDGGNALCSGTVIASNAVLTAAHCVTGGVTADTVIVGGTRMLPVASVFPNASYNPNVGESYDLAVIITAGALGVAPIPVLLSRSAQPGEQVVFAGYGGDRDQGGTTGILRAGANRVTSITPDTIYINFTGQGSNACGGDSGGPILVLHGTEWVIAGVTARGSERCEVPGDSIWSNITFPEGAALVTSTVPGLQRR